MDSLNSRLTCNSTVPNDNNALARKLEREARSVLECQGLQQTPLAVELGESPVSFADIMQDKYLLEHLCTYLPAQELPFAWMRGAFPKNKSCRLVCKAFANAAHPAHLPTNTAIVSLKSESIEREEFLRRMLLKVLESKDNPNLDPEQANEWSVFVRIIKNATSFLINSSNGLFICELLKVLDYVRPHQAGASNNLQIYVRHLYLHRMYDESAYITILKQLKNFGARVWSTKIDLYRNFHPYFHTMLALDVDRYIGLDVLSVLGFAVLTEISQTTPKQVRGTFEFDYGHPFPQLGPIAIDALRKIKFCDVETRMDIDTDLTDQESQKSDIILSLQSWASIVVKTQTPIKFILTKALVSTAGITKETLQSDFTRDNVRVTLSTSLSSSSAAAATIEELLDYFQFTYEPLC